MNPQKDYKLINIQRKDLKLRAVRQEILACESEKALELILDAPSPATLIQSFPDQDLYYLMHRIGPYDFIPILSLAKSTQWEYILDVEVWNEDRLDTGLMTRSFNLLFQADPERFLRWVMKEKPDYFEFYLFKNMDIFIREHDELPPEDFDDYITLDDKFYFRFPDKPKIAEEKRPGPQIDPDAWELIEKMVKTVARMDLSVFHGLLLETSTILTAETEEEQFRLKTLRLAEKGFLPAHEAIGIYQPARFSSLRKRPRETLPEPDTFDRDIPLPPQFFARFLEGEDLFVRTLELFEPQFLLTLESELAALINKIISADRIKLRDKEDLEKSISKACAYLNIGLEVILDGDDVSPGRARGVIYKYFLEDIFRTGSRACIKLKTKADKWFRHSFMNRKNLSLSFLGETFLGVIGGLFIERPLYYDNFAAGDRYRNFKSISDITRTGKILRQIIALDGVLDNLDVDIKLLKKGMFTYKTLILTLWARNRLNLSSTFEPIHVNLFKAFFAALFSKSNADGSGKIQLGDLVLWISETTGKDERQLENFREILTDLINELNEEYAAVDPENIDPRFIPHFLLTNDRAVEISK